MYILYTEDDMKIFPCVLDVYMCSDQVVLLRKNCVCSALSNSVYFFSSAYLSFNLSTSFVVLEIRIHFGHLCRLKTFCLLSNQRYKNFTRFRVKGEGEQSKKKKKRRVKER